MFQGGDESRKRIRAQHNMSLTQQWQCDDCLDNKAVCFCCKNKGQILLFPKKGKPKAAGGYPGMNNIGSNNYAEEDNYNENEDEEDNGNYEDHEHKEDQDYGDEDIDDDLDMECLDQQQQLYDDEQNLDEIQENQIEQENIINQGQDESPPSQQQQQQQQEKQQLPDQVIVADNQAPKEDQVQTSQEQQQQEVLGNGSQNSDQDQKQQTNQEEKKEQNVDNMTEEQVNQNDELEQILNQEDQEELEMGGGFYQQNEKNDNLNQDQDQQQQDQEQIDKEASLKETTPKSQEGQDILEEVVEPNQDEQPQLKPADHSTKIVLTNIPLLPRKDTNEDMRTNRNNMSSPEPEPNDKRFVVRCTLGGCFKYYHVDCVYQNKNVSCINSMKVQRFRCPLHYCEICQASGDSVLIVQCVNCPTAYHLKCLPQDLKAIRLTKKYIICGKHEMNPENFPKYEEKSGAYVSVRGLNSQIASGQNNSQKIDKKNKKKKLKKRGRKPKNMTAQDYEDCSDEGDEGEDFQQQQQDNQGPMEKSSNIYMNQQHQQVNHSMGGGNGGSANNSVQIKIEPKKDTYHHQSFNHVTIHKQQQQYNEDKLQQQMHRQNSSSNDLKNEMQHSSLGGNANSTQFRSQGVKPLFAIEKSSNNRLQQQ